jgi:hypothetical protein
MNEKQLETKIIENKFTFLYTLITCSVINLFLIIIYFALNNNMALYTLTIYNIIFMIGSIIQYYRGKKKYGNQ